MVCHCAWNLSLVVSGKEQALSFKSIANGCCFFYGSTLLHGKTDVSGQCVLQCPIPAELTDEKLMLSDFHKGKILQGSFDARDDFLLHVHLYPNRKKVHTSGINFVLN